MLGLCDDGQQPPGWHNPAVGAEKPGTPLFALWVLQKKISKYFLLYAPVFCSQPGYGVQCWQNKAASCSCGCLGSRGAAQSFWVWVAAPKRHFSPQPLRCSERDHGRCLALWSGLSAALHSVMELLGWRRPRYYIQGRGTEIVSPPPGRKIPIFPVLTGECERGGMHFSPLPAALAQAQLPASSQPPRSLFPCLPSRSKPRSAQAAFIPGQALIQIK